VPGKRPLDEGRKSTSKFHAERRHLNAPTFIYNRTTMVAPSADPWSQYDSTRSVTSQPSGKENNKRAGGGGWRGAWSNRFRKPIPGGLHTESSTPVYKESKVNGRGILKKYENIRTAKISVTVVKPSKDSKWGFGIVQDENDDQVVRIKAMTDEGLLRNCPFKEGDILRTVNNKKCLEGKVTIDKLVNYDGGIPVTLIAESPNGNSKLVQAMTRKPNSESLIGIGFYNIEHEGSSLLIINHLAPTGLLAYSSLSQGDLVISINGVPCSRMISEEAEEMLRDSGSTVNIVAMRSAALHEVLNPSFTQRLAKRAMWAAGALFAGGPSPAAGNQVPSEVSLQEHPSENVSVDRDDDLIALARTESDSTATGRDSRASHSRSISISHSEIALSMMTDTEDMDDTISELSFAEYEQELTAGFSDEITEDLSSYEMEDVLIA
jgi:hypothetical protein